MLEFVPTYYLRNKYLFQEKAQKALAKAIFVSGQPLALPEHPLWQDFFKELRPEFSPPSRKVISTKLLDDEYGTIKQEIDKKIEEAKVLHIAIDGWTNLRNEPILNVVIYTPEPYFYDFIETKQNRHTAQYISEEICKVIDKIGSEKVLLVITDNASNMIRCGKILEEKYRNVKWTGCLAHTLNLLIGDIAKNQSVEKLLSDAASIVKCIQSSHILTADFNATSKLKNINKSLQLPVKTRWGSQLNCIQSLLDCKIVLQNMALNSGGLDKYKNLLLNEDFWHEIDILKSYFTPIVKWITRLEGDYGSLHFVHGAFKELGELIHNQSGADFFGEGFHNDLKLKFQNRKATALKPIHYAATLLNPQNRGATLSADESLDGWEFIIHIAETQSLAIDDLMKAVSDYKCGEGLWRKPFVWESTNKLSPLDWWKLLYDNTDLGALAIKILTAPATSASVERSFSTFSNIHTKKRNKLNTERAGKICLISHNWKIMNRKKKKSAQQIQVNQESTTCGTPSTPSTSRESQFDVNAIEMDYSTESSESENSEPEIMIETSNDLTVDPLGDLSTDDLNDED